MLVGEVLLDDDGTEHQDLQQPPDQRDLPGTKMYPFDQVTIADVAAICQQDQQCAP